MTVVSCIILLWLSFGRSSTEETDEQEYFQKMAQLEARLKQDLRAAILVKKEADGVYSIETVHLTEDGIPEKKVFVYWVDETGFGVTRHDQQTKEYRVWDFSRILDKSKSFVFEIDV